MRSIRLVLVAALVVAATAAPAADATWPRQFAADGNQLLVNQPQLDAWPSYLTLNGRAAVVVTAKGGTSTPGTLQITARTDTNLQARTVALSDIQITHANFPGADAQTATQAETLAKALLPKGSVSLPLDALLASLAASNQGVASVQLNTTPPKVFVSAQPARLVVFDGPPAFATVAGTNVQYAINTNWPLLRGSDAPNYYLLDSGGWLVTDTLESGVWQYTDQLPGSFSQLPDTPAWQEVRKNIPAPSVEGQPPLAVDISTTPAELIVMVGEPQYQRIPGTGIFALQNTESLVFWDGYAKNYYYLVAGRWFRAPSLDGPWVFATNDLPADFASIPPDGPLAAVLASVPNTTEAREAAFRSQIPHMAVVSRKDVKADVTYAGQPQFAPIAGTSLSYAVNTASDVIQVGSAYYLCKSGVWFTAASPSGPWAVATSVPNQIYAIPPSSPVYKVTYVKVYQVADDSVVDGYTGGYLGEYVADGVVSWGTGYYYTPYIAVDAAPYYYARPYTYGCDAFYDPLTGTFHRAGYGYGPYGGIGVAATYDPYTGTYARGAAVAGPNDAGAVGQAYNARTGTYAAGYTRSNPYASWEQGVVNRGGESARESAYSTDRGTVGEVQTSRGGEAVGVSDGDRSAAVVRAPDGDVYAGSDGNLYRRTDDGWQRYGVPEDTARQRPADDAAVHSDAPREAEVVYSQPAPRSGMGVPVDAYGDVPAGRSWGNPAGGVDPAVWRGLNQDYAARQRSWQLQQRYGSWSGSEFRGLGGGRYGGRR